MTTNSIQRTRRVIRVAALTVALLVTACNFDILNQNAPTEDQLTNNPSKLILARVATGIFFGNFSEVGADIQIYTIYGREGYNLLGNDPRETGEAISGPQDPGGRAGGNWFRKYAAIRTINTYLRAVNNTINLTAEEKSASLGFAQTMKAAMFLRLAVRSGTYGLPIDVDRAIDAAPAPFVSQDAAFAYVSALFDSAKTSLQGAGSTAFPFPIAPGFESFNTPPLFLQFNRALKARAEVFRATFLACATCWTSAQTALSESFLTRTGLPGSLSLGAYYGYNIDANEPQNPITENLDAVRYFVHPSLAALVQNQAGGAPDARWSSKTRVVVPPRDLNGVSSGIKPVMYNNNAGGGSVADLGADIAIIKNEELLLLSAEVNLGLANKAAAIADIDSVRIHSGGLAPTTLTIVSLDSAFVTEILYNRLMSLLWEQGVRWIDARRYGRLASLPIDRPGDAVFPSLIVPAGECDARGLDSPCTPPVSP